jgi:anhydro-N-acetylmuramic acid kinase
MNSNLQRLYLLAKKSSRLIIGLMSGTSLDGLDIALCQVEGAGFNTKAEVLAFQSIPYPDALRQQIKEVFAQKQVSWRSLSGLHVYLADLYAQWILESLALWKIDPKTIDLIASHGQTMFHAPQRLFKDNLWPSNTFQLVDGDHIAYKTGMITISDFRQKHVAAGAEGAPLALYGDCLLFQSNLENRILLNMGGIANITYLPKDMKGAFATDTGPANTLINQYVQKHFHLPMDEDARLAQKGQCHPKLLNFLIAHPYFDESIPKTTGPEQFHLDYLTNAQFRSGTIDLDHEDILATLHHLSARTIANTIKKIDHESNTHLYASGGGYHNPLLMKLLKDELPNYRMDSIATLGVTVDAKEALLFALLANECVAGNPSTFEYLRNAPAVSMGKISFPN